MQLEIIVLGKGIQTLKKIIFVSFVDPILYRDTQLHTHTLTLLLYVCRHM